MDINSQILWITQTMPIMLFYVTIVKRSTGGINYLLLLAFSSYIVGFPSAINQFDKFTVVRKFYGIYSLI